MVLGQHEVEVRFAPSVAPSGTATPRRNAARFTLRHFSGPQVYLLNPVLAGWIAIFNRWVNGGVGCMAIPGWLLCSAFGHRWLRISLTPEAGTT